MYITYRDVVDCSIEFESQNELEKKVIMDLYLLLMSKSDTEVLSLLKKLTGDVE